MNENENEKVVSKKDLVAPIVSIIAFLLLLGGASYAYYNIGSVATGGNVGANVQLPARCIATVSSNSTCSASLTTAEMNPANKGVKSNTASCGITVTVNGNKNCSCSYTTQLLTSNATAFTSTHYVTNSMSYAISGGRQVAETNIAAGWTNNTSVLASKTLTVATTGTAVSETLTLALKMYNRDADQDKMAGKSYVMYLYASPTCSIPTN